MVVHKTVNVDSLDALLVLHCTFVASGVEGKQVQAVKSSGAEQKHK